MTLSLEQLQAQLSTPVRYFDTVDSTNDLATEWLKAGAVHGSAVIADEQRKGRGRLGRTWYTPPGVALAISVILRPTVHQLPLIGIAAAVSVAELCQALDIADVTVKWPNDVRIGGKKVCGILPEAIWSGDQLAGVVLGIGVNVRVQFDAELAQIATSLETVAGKPLNRAQLAVEIVQRVNDWSHQLTDGRLFSRWKSMLDTLGKQVQVQDIQGLAVDVDASGALLLQQPNGQVQRVIAGDVMLNEG